MFIEYIMAAAAAAGFSLSKAQAEKLEVYHRMLCSSNEKFNLTRVPSDFKEAIDRNYLDSMAAAALISGSSEVVDVGSGAGFPGIPLSIVLPDTRFTLMDSLGKRVDFLSEVIDALGLNARAVHLRSEDAARGSYREAFDAAVARAVAPMNVLAELMLPLVRPGGLAIAYKGPALGLELDEAQNALSILGGELYKTEAYSIPNRDWERSLAVIEKVTSTPEKYPRRAGLAEKRPLK